MEFEGNYATASSCFNQLKAEGSMTIARGTFFNRIVAKEYPSIKLGAITLVNVDDIRVCVSREGNIR